MLPKEYNETIALLANSRQLEYYQSYCRGNGVVQIAKEFDVNHSAVSVSLKRLEKAASAKDLIPNHTPETGVAPGYKLKGTSTLYGDDGQPKLTWVKTKEDMVRVEDKMKELCEVLIETTPVRSPISNPPAKCLPDYLAMYPLGDPHLGLYAWAEETGDDFDCNICEALIIKAVDRLVDAMPPAKVGRVLNLGDFFHSDTEDAQTRRNHNPLDTDGRWGRVLKIGVRMFTHCIDRALEKHEEVEVVCEIGNHDDYTAHCLALIMEHHYRDNDRVKVDTTYSKYHYREFGSCLFGSTHGMVKPDALHKIMTSDRPEAWGRTKHRYWHVGHLHHSWVKEIAGVLIEGFRSLKGKDAYEAEKGYRAGRSMNAILFHADYGEAERHTVSLEMLREE